MWYLISITGWGYEIDIERAILFCDSSRAAKFPWKVVDDFPSILEWTRKLPKVAKWWSLGLQIILTNEHSRRDEELNGKLK